MPAAPNTLNYMVGKGKVYFNRLDADNEVTGELDLGNDPTFSAAPTTEILAHYSSMEGIKKKDKSSNISTDIGLKFTLDEVNVENLNLAFMGDQVQYVNQGDGNAVNEPVLAKLGRWMKFGFRNVTEGTVVLTDAVGAVNYILNTDYRIDYEIGRVFCIAGGAIANNQALLINYTYEAQSLRAVYPATRPEVEGLLRFVGNCTFGSDYEIIFWRTKVTISGEVGFISDEWAQFEFTGEVLDDTVNHPDNPYGMILELDTTQIEES